ncbi:hypothetical protein HYN59_04735 [Flavobacterium album]|uniref:Uncharacterized protein n=1 Tax=Flavobacterium album TaxID=2175091 RepID=A0A2S1QVP3_9FLAO|nr:hypothetical protein [Flavobacterium album]AWH84465.1 hypothetical protein HYN59_04735 [Flavobacterium album]
MEAKKISTEQFSQLLAFTRKHFVEYYDLQVELADHLANAIEQRWQAQPALTFDEALHLEFKKFGIFGFSDIVEQRQNALFKKYYRLVRKELLSALTFRAVLIAVLGTLAVYEIVMLLPWSYFVLLLGSLIVSCYRLWQLRRQYKKKLDSTGKKWLLEEIIFSCGGLGIMLNLPFQLLRYVLQDNIPSGVAAAMALILILSILYGYVVLFRMPRHAEAYLQKAYPEYAMEN